MDAPQTPKAVIDALGGRELVEESLHVGPSAISNWLKHGFPKSRMPDLLALAARAGAEKVTLPLLMGMEAKYPERRPAEAA